MDESLRLAVERTRLAHERTLMAWVRTATSLISFGFSIYKFFDLMPGDKPGTVGRLFGPRGFSMIMITLGIGSLVLATLQQRHELRILETHYGHQPRSTAMMAASVVSCLGVLALLLVFGRQ